ncbi:hypothetical protein B1H58_17660 [Pantoea alhagi]|uniref:Uncharacterized protein n=1 Tax=Pantoea alhagi TaxID=1891675 RepID=A0A1W6B9E6_9GAMM|nr:hypothetical protein [Pantoea alhagi]ARJ43691.1 hypothetical protein B1H58_17660 [Pantoea alhagi]
MRKTQAGCYIPFPNESYQVEPLDRKGKHFSMDAKALYLTWTHSKIFVNYAGEQAGESHTTMELPRDPDFLRLMAKKLEELASSI